MDFVKISKAKINLSEEAYQWNRYADERKCVCSWNFRKRHNYVTAC